MKKFYFFLVAMLVSVAASATSVYFENTLGWSSVNCYCWSPEVSKWPGDAVYALPSRPTVFISWYAATR